MGLPDGHPWVSPGHSLIRVFTMVQGCHVDDLLVFVNFKKESPWADPVSPGVWLPLAKLFDIGTEMGLLPELRVNVVLQLG